jgi:hypothetical protein
MNKQCRTASVFIVEKANSVGATLHNIETPGLVSALRVSEWEPFICGRIHSMRVTISTTKIEVTACFETLPLIYRRMIQASWLLKRIIISLPSLKNRRCWSLLS